MSLRNAKPWWPVVVLSLVLVLSGSAQAWGIYLIRLEWFHVLPDTDGDGTLDIYDDDDDGDRLSDAEEASHGTNPLKADSDDDGYSDYAELHYRCFTSPAATYRSEGVDRADPTRPDIFIELDFLGPQTGFLGIQYDSHEPDGEYLEDMIQRFEEHGYSVFICVDDAVPQDGRDVMNEDDVFEIKQCYQDEPSYYYCLYGDESDGSMAGNLGVAWYRSNTFVVWHGVWYLVGDIIGMTTMHELGHLLMDTYPENPKASHLLDHPEVFDDGAHCPYSCVMNYAQNMSIGELLDQWWEFDYGHRCWEAMEGRGFKDMP